MGAAQQRLGGHLRRRPAQPAVAEQHVDAVAGGRERRRHALEGGQPGKGIDGSVVTTGQAMPGTGPTQRVACNRWMTSCCRQARSFGSVADVYDRGRPSFPREAAEWLVGTQPVTVLELGAGTGKLTEQLVALGHDVHATDPTSAMLDVLRRGSPTPAPASPAPRTCPVPDRSVDVVVAAQCFHWFDHDRALPEIARVLKPGGQLALVWNARDERIPWVRRLGGSSAARTSSRRDRASRWCSPACSASSRRRRSRIWQEINRESIHDLALSRSNVATLDDDARAAKLDEVLRVLRRLRPRAWTACSCRTTPGASRPSSPTGRTTETPTTGETASDEPPT